MKNSDVSKVFREIAQILEIMGDNVFRIRAYRRAADVIDGLGDNLETLLREDRLTGIPGIGLDLAAKIREISETGSLAFHEELKKKVPAGVLALLAIPTIGPKTAVLLNERLAISNIDDLKRAIADKKLDGLPGIKEKTIANILKGIAIASRGTGRMFLPEAMRVASSFVKPLSALAEVRRVAEAGSLRRRKETVRDIDILVVSEKPEAVMEAFTSLGPVADVVAKGPSKATIRTGTGVQVDCRVVGEDSFGAALFYFTGSKSFNVRLRSMAVKKGLKINEYGIYRGKRKLGGRTEEEIFSLLKMQNVDPELREDAGEIELAMKGKLPRLISRSDIKGDLHAHSSWSDGGDSLEDMAMEAKRLGHAYLAVTDHSQGLKIAGGLDSDALTKKRREIDRLNAKLAPFRILYAAEVDIDSEGNLDYPEKELERFEIVVAAIHSGFRQGREAITRRIVKACLNRHVHIIAHLTGRLWGSRDPYEVDTDQVLKAAARTNTALEINSFPQRLDINDQTCRMAKEAGVRIAINTDSHAVEHLANIDLGICVGRRGWLTADDVINTLRAEQILKTIQK